MEYDVYLSDVMGTTTPMSEVEKLENHLLGSEEVKKKVAEEVGIEQDSIDDRVKLYREKCETSEKDTPEFKMGIKMLGVSSEIGYSSGDITQTLNPGVTETLEDINDYGARFAIYGSGAKSTTRAAFETNGLNDKIEKVFSSSDIGSKSEAKSYKIIARELGVDESKICYVTDSVKEADAAVKAKYGKVFLMDQKGKLGFKDGYEVIDQYNSIIDKPDYDSGVEQVVAEE